MIQKHDKFKSFPKTVVEKKDLKSCLEPLLSSLSSTLPSCHQGKALRFLNIIDFRT